MPTVTKVRSFDDKPVKRGRKKGSKSKVRKLSSLPVASEGKPIITWNCKCGNFLKTTAKLLDKPRCGCGLLMKTEDVGILEGNTA